MSVRGIGKSKDKVLAREENLKRACWRVKFSDFGPDVAMAQQSGLRLACDLSLRPGPEHCLGSVVDEVLGAKSQVQ